MTTGSDLDSQYRISESDRRIGGGMRIGQVSEVDAEKGLIRVRLSDANFDNADAQGDNHPGNETDWMPWFTGAAGSMKRWHVPVVGEQVSVMGSGGEPSQGLAFPGVFSNANPPPSTDPDKTVTEWDDGARVIYDRKSHQMAVTVPDGGRVDIGAPAGSKVTATDGDLELETGGGQVKAIAKGAGMTVEVLAGGFRVNAEGGQIELTGDVTIDGNVTVKGTVQVEESVIAEQQVVAGTVSLRTHIHWDPQGGVTTPPIPG